MTAEQGEFKRSFVQNLWYAWYKLMGWTAEYSEPDAKSYVVIVWPHTSNLDFLIGFIFSRAYPMPFPHFLAKESVFRGVLGKLGRAVGGIPVRRSERTNLVEQVTEAFKQNERLVLAITPEGTRSKTHYWKSGFYYMAQAANVPIVMATIDYGKKMIRYGSWFMPSGDIEADMEIIRRFYAGAQGRHPERQGEIRLKPAHEPQEPRLEASQPPEPGPAGGPAPAAEPGQEQANQPSGV